MRRCFWDFGRWYLALKTKGFPHIKSHLWVKRKENLAERCIDSTSRFHPQNRFVNTNRALEFDKTCKFGIWPFNGTLPNSHEVHHGTDIVQYHAVICCAILASSGCWFACTLYLIFKLICRRWVLGTPWVSLDEPKPEAWAYRFTSCTHRRAHPQQPSKPCSSVWSMANWQEWGVNVQPYSGSPANFAVGSQVAMAVWPLERVCCWDEESSQCPSVERPNLFLPLPSPFARSVMMIWYWWRDWFHLKPTVAKGNPSPKKKVRPWDPRSTLPCCHPMRVSWVWTCHLVDTWLTVRRPISLFAKSSWGWPFYFSLPGCCGNLTYLDISWHILTYLDISWHILTYLDISWHILTYLDISWHILTSLDISWHLLTSLDISWHLLTSLDISWHLLTSLDISWHLLTSLDISWHLLTSLDISWHLLTSLDISWHLLTSLDISWHLLTSLDISWHILTYLDISWHILTYLDISWHILTYLDISWHILTYLDVSISNMWYDPFLCFPFDSLVGQVITPPRRRLAPRWDLSALDWRMGGPVFEPHQGNPNMVNVICFRPKWQIRFCIPPKWSKCADMGMGQNWVAQ